MPHTNRIATRQRNMKSLVVVLAACLCTGSAASQHKDGDVPTTFESRRDSLYTAAIAMTKMSGEVFKLCGGAILNKDWFITAAECLDTGNTTVDSFEVTYASRFFPNQYVRNHFKIELLEYVVHSNYDETTKANNIALIKCKGCGRQGKKFIPDVPTKDDEKNSFSQEPAVITAVLKPQNSTNLQEHSTHYQKTKIVSPIWCKILHLLSVREEHICASSYGGSLPEGAIGAPLVIKGESEETMKLVGIATSIVPWTTWISLPIVFTKVAPYSEWIRNVTKTK